jgi:hypothetical protein
MTDTQKICIWIYNPDYGYYETFCNRTYKATEFDFVYCPYCGNKVEDLKENYQPF